jgi:cardiolipin synthase
MRLHELHKRAEWYSLPDTKRTSVQRLAARTQGVITPANGVSIVGAAGTILGLIIFYRHYHIAGLVLVGVGRICDILDGHVARKTHTSSPFGEGLDAGLDKLVVVIACGLLIAGHIVPVFLGAVLLIVQLIIAGLALAVRHDGQGLHPSRMGKYAMFGLWVSLGLFMIAHALPEGSWTQVIWLTALIGLLMVLSAELSALREYLRIARRRHFRDR